MSRENNLVVRIVAIAAATAALAACATPAPPPPPPPPPPPAEIIPLRPFPPAQAPYVMEIPQKNAFGVRQTINTGISADEKVWYFRSAWNVAALNCLGVEGQPILDGYSHFIKHNAKALKAVNDRIDAHYHKQHSQRVAGIRARETRMTMVYNYFTLPSARASFCKTALDISQRYTAAVKPDPVAFATANFPLFEGPFEEFFVAYEQYLRDAAAWDAQYGARYGASQPGWVATQKALAARAVPTVTGNPAVTTGGTLPVAGTVIDQTSGALIPVVPVTGNPSVPVVQPIPTDAGRNDSPKR